ncbi:hypothetical protein LBMAG32_00880 [Nitrosomonadaceae bacterium]|nr:hypothetical protein LBMAG32_00880 [Nitrosomonadaceae bacterium]
MSVSLGAIADEAVEDCSNNEFEGLTDLEDGDSLQPMINTVVIPSNKCRQYWEGDSDFITFILI